ncbi:MULTISPECIES: AAA family ATPase [Erysipelotrichaceae]|mgnify:CR=1 FL=1|uniref:AAA family ATPase n=1 Tax=Erysipelotrichaceae TaxID=128827 RepID=UPI001F4618B7|nr:AAA family ATPase [Absiella sp. AM27-20]
MRYCNKLLTLPADNADNALYLGTALHTGLEKGVDEAIKEYLSNYTMISDEIENEIIKLEKVIPMASKMIPKGQHEVKIEDEDFIGYIDLLTPATGFHDSEIPNVYDIYDFKYSNNIKNYMDSDQLHLYKYFFEKNNPDKKIRNLYFLFVPKVNIKQKKTETLQQFRNRIIDELNRVEPSLVKIEYDKNKVIEFLIRTKRTLEATEYPKVFGWLCNYCEYADYCKKGIDYMLLPKNERRNIEKIEKKVIWIYGAPFSGKTTFANCFPDPLMLNTDGNIKFVDAPYISIKDIVTTTGRMTNRKLAWENFKETIEELEKKDNTFKTIIVDLLEDCYEHCRLYMYKQMGITHESDDSFKAWDKVRTEFLSTLKRLMNMDYENIILISHEDTSKDITKRGGDKITAIKPNLQEKAANKVAGMVDIVARIVVDGDNHILSFKSDEVVFGGGRLTVSTREIPLDYDAFLEVYDEANKNAVAKMNGELPKETEKPKATTSGRKGRKATKPTSEEETPSKQEENNENEGVNDAPVSEEKLIVTDDLPESLKDEKPPVEDEKTETPQKTRRTRKTRGTKNE